MISAANAARPLLKLKLAGPDDLARVEAVRANAPQTGLIVHQGYIVAEWGDPHKVDNTFSVAKSC